jgi:hypothetical protein
MPAVSLTTLPTIPYVYSATTTATINKCQIITLPTGIYGLTVHNRDKATKALRVSFASDLVQDGTSPAVFFTVDDPLLIDLGANARTGFPAVTQLALFSDSASVNYEVLFRP